MIKKEDIKKQQRGELNESISEFLYQLSKNIKNNIFIPNRHLIDRLYMSKDHLAYFIGLKNNSFENRHYFRNLFNKETNLLENSPVNIAVDFLDDEITKDDLISDKVEELIID